MPPLRSRTLANLSYTEKGSIENASHKATFYEAAWDGGKSIVRGARDVGRTGRPVGDRDLVGQRLLAPGRDETR